MPIKIFLSSILLLSFLSCGKKVEVSVINHKTQSLNNYITEFDENKCEFVTVDNTDKMTTPLSDPSVDGMVCFSRKTASSQIAKAKADCINKRPNPNKEIKNESPY
ncbi:hypothetical protein EKK58_08350 [Candidatus Dependentiae bacterium]|nr:MAG: hypothetical protein EKK58_08350 [Candidatus Dependentiae bacterium]